MLTKSKVDRLILQAVNEAAEYGRKVGGDELVVAGNLQGRLTAMARQWGYELSRPDEAMMVPGRVGGVDCLIAYEEGEYDGRPTVYATAVCINGACVDVDAFDEDDINEQLQSALGRQSDDMRDDAAANAAAFRAMGAM